MHMVEVDFGGDPCAACPVVGAAPHASYVIAGDQLVWANDAAVALLGATSATELTGSTVFDRVAPEDHEVLRRRLGDASIEAGARTRTDLTLIRVDGSRLEVEVECAPVTFAGARAALLLVRDISERKALERAKELAERRHRQMFESSPIGIATVDSASGRILEANPAYEAILGRRFGKDDTTTWRELTHPDDVAEDLAQMRRLNADEIKGYALNQRLRHRDGAYRWVRLNVARVSSEGAQPRHLAMIDDITDRVVARQSIEASERKLRTIFETMSEGVALNEAVYDDNGVMVDYRVIEVNDAFARVANVPTEVAIGGLATEIYKMTPEMITEFWRDHRDRREVRRVEFQGPKDGRFFMISTSPFQDDRFVTAFFDITEQRRLGEAFRQAQKLESIGRLAGGVAHDFNNLLTVIFGNLELAMGDLPPGSEIRDLLAEAQRAAQRSSALTRQLLAFARRTPIEPRRLDLNAAVADSLKMLGRLIGEHIALQWQPDPSCGPVRVDPGQLDQILANLCVNARDAIAGTGSIRLTTAPCQFDAVPVEAPDAAPGCYVRLSIADSGSGIPAEVLPHIFEPFFTTKVQGVGTGLGLSTVFGAVKQHGGFVTVDSQPGEGATFHVHLPCADDADDEDTESAGSTASAGTGVRGTVLVVEDEVAIGELVSTALNMKGYAVLVAATPAAALAMVDAARTPIDLLLTDVVMPELSGVALAAEVRRRRPGLPVLFMTGYEAQEFGGDMPDSARILRKPFTLEELQWRVQRALTESAT